MEKKSSVVEVLQELTEFVNDGREGYLHAAKESKNMQNQAFYEKLSKQRSAFADELNQVIRAQGGEAETSTTIKGKIYRQWMDLKATLTGSDENAIIGSNIHGEEWAQKAYKDALDNEELPENVKQLVQKQMTASQQALEELKQMKENK
jgi:uncharacterized protein (TIGR02284 family)